MNQLKNHEQQASADCAAKLASISVRRAETTAKLEAAAGYYSETVLSALKTHGTCNVADLRAEFARMQATRPGVPSLGRHFDLQSLLRKLRG